MKVEEALERISIMLAKVTPEIVDTAIEVYRLQAIQGTAQTFVGFVLAVVTGLLAVKMYKVRSAIAKDGGYSGIGDIATGVSLVSSCVSAVFIAVFSHNITLTHYFIGIWNPKLFAAYKLIESISK